MYIEVYTLGIYTGYTPIYTVYVVYKVSVYVLIFVSCLF